MLRHLTGFEGKDIARPIRSRKAYFVSAQGFYRVQHIRVQHLMDQTTGRVSDSQNRPLTGIPDRF